ncbi:MAG: type II 3-dehydroquinate dehydratase [Flavobacteriaceae bacterium]|nr:type II 3-dehydroquinate dehydratase [Flavobacteriaceae bacterium]
MKIIIINGPNLNLLGARETSIYGSESFDVFFEKLKVQFGNIDLEYFQTNHEGGIIDKLHEIGFSYDGVVLNAGAYTHTSMAIGDAIKAIDTPVVEVHISNTYARESFRQKSYLAANAKGVITGFGMDSYKLGLYSFM